MKLTGAAILVSRGIKVLQAAPAAYPYRSPALFMDSAFTIKEALDSLLAQPDDACPFVIIEDAASQKFVQFVGSLDRPLLLDLPAQTLSEVEFYRAVTFFKRRGVVGEEYEMLDKSGGRAVGEQFTFRLQLASVSDAIEIVDALFDEV